MKVLIISPCGLPVPATKGGAVANLIETLIKENDKKEKLEFTVISSFDSKAFDKAKEYKKSQFVWVKHTIAGDLVDKLVGIIFPSKKGKAYAWKLRVIRKIKAHLRRNDYDKIVIENAGFLLKIFEDKALLDKYKGKIFYHVHNDIPDNISVSVLKELELILVSNYVGNKITEIADEKIKDKFHVLYNGIYSKDFQEKISQNEHLEIRKKLGICDTDKIILFVGRPVKEKGIEQLITAFDKLDCGDKTLLIVGTPEFAKGGKMLFDDKVNEIIAKNNKIKFTGYVSYEDVCKYYAISNVAVLPSVWKEPSGLTMVEALAAGVPLITTNLGGIGENIFKEHALLIDDIDNLADSLVAAINDVLNDEKLWKEKAVAGREFVDKERSADTYYKRFCDILCCK